MDKVYDSAFENLLAIEYRLPMCPDTISIVYMEEISRSFSKIKTMACVCCKARTFFEERVCKKIMWRGLLSEKQSFTKYAVFI